MGNQSSNIAFVAPQNTGGAPIVLYYVMAFQGGTPTGIFATGSASPIEITGLTNGLTYTFEVYAENSAGLISAWSAPSNAFTPEPTVPSPPLSPNASPANASAIVTFSAPATNGGEPIFSYTATSSPGAITGSVTGFGSITVSPLVNGTPYTFTVVAINSVGDSAPSVASNSVTPSASATVPTPPLSPSAIAGNASATVSFLAPASSGGSTITGYTATSSPGSFTHSGAASPLVVGGLSNGTAYTFTVIATNAVGNSSPSVATSPVTPSSGIVAPTPPTNVTGVAGNTQVTLNFTAPSSNGGSPIQSYTATSAPGAHTATIGGPNANPITVPGLTNGQAYTFTITATNAAGLTSAPSTPSTAITPVTAPSTPETIAASPGNTTATITYTAPLSNGGAAITGYTAISSPGSITGVASATTPTTPIVVTGLTNGMPYSFYVTATNAAGLTSAQGGPSDTVTPSTVPGPPTGVSGVAGNATIEIFFTPPSSDGGSQITGYTATSVAPGPTGKSGTNTTSPITVTGLVNGTSYYFTAVASNIDGNSVPSSPAIGPVIPVTVPTPPLDPSAVAGNASATVTFNVPTSTGGSPILQYTVSAIPGAGIAPAAGSGSPITIYNLTNGTSYQFVVVATSAVGASLPSVATAPVTPEASSGGFIIEPPPVGLPSGTVGVPYSGGPISAGGGGSIPPYTFYNPAPLLPAGLQLTVESSTTVNVTGTPTASGNFTPGFQATDSSGGAGFPVSNTVADNEGNGTEETPAGIASTTSVPVVAGLPMVALTTCATYEASVGGGYPALRQTVTGASPGTGETTSVSCTSATATAAGSTILVFAANSYFENHVTSSITDNVGNVYDILLQTNDTNTLGPDQQGAQNQSLSVCVGAKAGASTWKATPTGTEDYLGIYVMEFTSSTGVTAPIGTYTGPPTGIGGGLNNVNTGTANLGTAPITLVGFFQNTGPVSGSGTAGTAPIAFTTAGTTTPNWDWGGPNNALVEIANVTPAGNVGATASFTSGNWTLQQAIGVLGTGGSGGGASGLHTGRGLQTANGDTCTLQTYLEGPDYTSAGAPINASQETDLWLINAPAGGTTTFQQWFGTAGFGGANTGDQDYQASLAFQYSSGSTFIGYGAFTAQTGAAYAGVAHNTALLSGSIALTGADVPCTLYGFCTNTSSLGTNFVATPNTIAGAGAPVNILEVWSFATPAVPAANTSCYASWQITTPGTYQASFNQNSTSLNCFQTVCWAVKGAPTGALETQVLDIPLTIAPAGGAPDTPVGLQMLLMGQTSAHSNSPAAGAVAPTNGSAAQLTWELSGGATSYTVQRSNSPSITPTNYTTVSAPPWSETNAPNIVGSSAGPNGGVFWSSTPWCYRVVANNAAGSSLPSAQHVYNYCVNPTGPVGSYEAGNGIGNDFTGGGGTITYGAANPFGGAGTCVKIVQPSSGYWLPVSGNLATGWNFPVGAFANGFMYIDIGITAALPGDAYFEIVFLQQTTESDEYILNSGGNPNWIRLAPYGTLAPGAFATFKIPVATLLTGYGNGEGGTIQTSVYKFNLNCQNAALTYYVNNIIWSAV